MPKLNLSQEIIEYFGRDGDMPQYILGYQKAKDNRFKSQQSFTE